MESQNKAYVVVLPARNGDPEEFVFIEEEEDDDLSHWELIHSSDSEADDVESRALPFPPLLFSSPTAVDMVPDVDYRGFDHEPSDDVYGEPYTRDQEDDDDDDDDDDDLDDELIPRDLAGKFGRQRMRKLGKRAFAKMNNSKRSPFLYVKPGCVRGKHGLGLKHSF